MQGFLEATVITDQLGRSMTIVYGNAVTPNPVAYDLIKTISTNGLPLTYEIDWETIGVNKNYWAANAAGAAALPYYLTLKSAIGVIKKISIQEQPQIPPYQFSYNASVVANWAAITNLSIGWGELSEITLPSGATTDYAYSLDGVQGDANNSTSAFDVMNNGPSSKTLKYTAENDCATAPCPQVQEVTGYSCFWWDKTRNTADYCTVVTPDGGTTKTENGVQSGLTFRTTKPDGTVTENFWAQNDGSSMASPTPVQHSIPYPPPMNPFVRWEYTSIPNSASTLTQTIIKDTSVDLNGNTTQANEYDFDNYSDYIALQVDGFGIRHGKPSSATMKRSMVNTYYNQAASTTAATYYQTPNSPRLLNLVSTTEVRDASGNVAAHSEVSYDDINNTGNVLQQRSWDSTKGALSPSTMVSVSHTYDSYGNPISTTDARGTVTLLNYGPITDNLGNQYTNLYPTDVYKAFTLPTQQHASSTYDFYTGLVTSSKDVDNNVTTNTTYDLLGRPILVVGAAGITGLERHTTTEYGDAQRRVIVKSDLNSIGDGLLVSIQHYDQMGRVRLTRKLENPTDSPYDETKGIKVQTRYFAGDGTNTNPDYHYAYQLVSNPYRAATSNAASDEPTMGWARTRTRARADQTASNPSPGVSETETFAGATLPGPNGPWGTNTTSTGKILTSHNANQVLVTDQAGKQRQSISDGLGRLAQVVEDPNGLNYLTTYSYDTLDNLTTVSQGNQTRSFAYSSLKRLMSATNPESGIVSYTYDLNGNLLTKTDVRSIVATMTYDPLNRVLSKTYSDATPQINYYYDNQTLPFTPTGFSRGYSIGRLVAVITGGASSSAGNYYGHDQIGQNVQKVQVSGTDFTMTASYNLAGGMTSETYPSGRTVNYGYDGAGRMASLNSPTITNAPVGVSLNNINYAPSGGLLSETYGNGLVHSVSYNSRLQPSTINLVSASTSASPLQLSYQYTSTSTSNDNNGNVLQITSAIGTNTFQQEFSYDGVNRLTYAYEQDNGSTTNAWQQAFGYDRYGNRQQYAGGTTSGAPDMTFDQNNKVTGMTYDSVGNMTYDGNHNYTFDAENKVIGYDGLANQYVYDGEGNRVWKQNICHIYGIGNKLIEEYRPQTSRPVGRVIGHTGGGTTPAAFTKEYVYGADGLLANIVQQSSGQYTTEYVTPDHLGTPRVTTDGASGMVIGWHDYQPFGEDIAPTVGARINIPQYGGADNLSMKFTSKERDTETGLDYFEARYYSSAQGRFTSPDILGGHLEDPQTLNHYSYVRNSPLILTDSTGLDWWYDKTKKEPGLSGLIRTHTETTKDFRIYPATFIKILLTVPGCGLY